MGWSFLPSGQTGWLAETHSLHFPFQPCHGIAPVPGFMLSSFTGQIFFYKEQGLELSFHTFYLKGAYRDGETVLQI